MLQPTPLVQDFDCMNHLKYIPIASTFFLGLIFMVTGVDKLVHYGQFLDALEHYVILPEGISKYIGLPVMLSEIWIGVGLFLKSTRKIALLGATAILAGFIVALTINYLTLSEANCGCLFFLQIGGATPLHIFYDIVLLSLAMYAWFTLAKSSESSVLVSDRLPV